MSCQQVLKVNVNGRMLLTQRLSRRLFHHMWPSIPSRSITVRETGTFQSIPTRGFLKCSLTRRLQQGSSLRTFRSSCCLGSPKEVVQFNLSDIGEGIGEVTIKEWFVETGSAVKQFDPICEVQSDKASVTITSRFDGTVKKLYHEIDSTAKVGFPLVDIETESSEGPVIDELNGETGAVGTGGSVSSSNLESYKKTLATPAVRRLAQEYSVKLSSIQGTGKDGRVMKEDILAFIQKPNSTPSDIRSTPSRSDPMNQEPRSATPSRSDPMYQTPVQSPKVASKGDRTEQLTPIQKAMFRSMTVSNTVPQFGLSDEINMSAFVDMKPFLKLISTDYNVHIRPLSFMIKAASMALHHFPILNSTVSDSGSKIADAGNVTLTFKSDHNIGFAMDTPSGLIVPNIKHVQGLSIVEISRELLRLQESGKGGKLNPSDLANGTFTLSNIGSVS